MLDKYPFHKLELVFFLSNARIALQKLIEFLSLKHNNSDNCPDASLEVIVKAHNSSISDNRVPNSKINELDITSATKILRTIKVFETSNSIPDGVNCVQSSCSLQRGTCNYDCKGCDHSCTKCKGKEYKSGKFDKTKCGDKCCMLDFKQICNHRCSNCGVLVKECKETIKLCCEKCKTCMHCIFKEKNLTNFDDIYQHLIDGQIDSICPDLKLRLSVNIISAFRNFLFHSTTSDYDQMDKGNFKNYQLPTYCDSWKTLKDTIHYATMTVLEYLPIERVSIYEREQYKSSYTFADKLGKNELIKIYGDQFRFFLNAEKIESISYSLERIEEQTRKYLNISILFTHIDSSNRLSIKHHGKDIRNAITSAVNPNGTQTLRVLLTREDFNPLNNSPEFYFILKSANGNALPEEYEDRYSDLSEGLWKTISKSITNNIHIVSKVEQNMWKLGSIIISAILYKCSADEEWTTEDITQIESCIPNIRQYLENERSEFNCQVEVMFKPGIQFDENVFSFQLLADSQGDAEQLYDLVNDPNLLGQIILSKFLFLL